MLISHDHRFIYTKTFKTAGTSVESYFEPYCMAPGTWSLSHDRAETVSAHGVVGFRGADQPPATRWWNHMSAAQIRAAVGVERWQGYFKFCVVRDPYDRALSAFYFARSKGRLPACDDDDALQFERWLVGGGLRMDREQYLIDGRYALDAVVRYESLAADLSAICRRLGLPWQPDRLPTFKAGIRPRDAGAALYTAAARRCIEQLCAFEFEQFGYAARANPLRSRPDGAGARPRCV